MFDLGDLLNLIRMTELELQQLQRDLDGDDEEAQDNDRETWGYFDDNREGEVEYFNLETEFRPDEVIDIIKKLSNIKVSFKNI